MAIALNRLKDNLSLEQLSRWAGLDEAFVCARRIVMGRLAKPEVGIQERLWAVLEDGDRQKPEVRRVLSEVMTEADWEAMVCDRP